MGELSATGSLQTQTPVDPIKYVERVKVRSNIISSKDVNVITLRNSKGENFEIQIEGAKHINSFVDALREQLSRSNADFNAAHLDAIVRTVKDQQSLSGSTKVKAVSQSFFSRLLEGVGLKKTPFLIPAEERELQPVRAQLKEFQELASQISKGAGVVSPQAREGFNAKFLALQHEINKLKREPPGNADSELRLQALMQLRTAANKALFSTLAPSEQQELQVLKSKVDRINELDSHFIVFRKSFKAGGTGGSELHQLRYTMRPEREKLIGEAEREIINKKFDQRKQSDSPEKLAMLIQLRQEVAALADENRKPEDQRTSPLYV